MLGDIWRVMDDMLGLGGEDLSAPEMALRALVVYVTALAMVRLGERRFMGKSTAFDLILGVILGSVVSRAITGQSPFIPTIATGFVLVGLHWLFAKLSYRWNGFSNLIKGDTRSLIKDGEVDWHAMKKSDLGRNDLLGALRRHGLADWTEVKEARLERNGDISVIRRRDEPQIVRAAVEGSELTVTIRLN